MKMRSFFLIATVAMTLCLFCTPSSNGGIKLVKSEHQVDVMVDGQLFTSYVFKPDLVKPILFPINSPMGTMINRGFPFIKDIEGESPDHPHHTGLFFTYDKVNEVGYWNATAPPPQIVHKEILEMIDGKKTARLTTLSEWTTAEDKVQLEEKRTVVFGKGPKERTMDLTITLTAKDTTIVFADTKEGMFGIRVAPWLKEKGGTGQYINAQGETTAANVWGKRSEWVALIGNKGDEELTLAIFDHPKSVNHPTYWHARNYGLFAANPLGQWKFMHDRGEENPEYLNFTLKPGESAVFKYNVLIYNGKLSKEELDARYKAFVKDWESPEMKVYD